MPVEFNVTLDRPSEQFLAQFTSRLVALKDASALFQQLGLDIEGHIAGRWRAPLAAGLAPLKPSTQEAKRRRWGYYRRPPGPTPVAQGTGFSFWWTSRAYARTQGPDSRRWGKQFLTYHFGRKSRERDRVEFMHFGSRAKGRPARPIYDQLEVERLVERSANDYFETLFGKGGTFRITRSTGSELENWP